MYQPSGGETQEEGLGGQHKRSVIEKKQGGQGSQSKAAAPSALGPGLHSTGVFIFLARTIRGNPLSPASPRPESFTCMESVQKKKKKKIRFRFVLNRFMEALSKHRCYYRGELYPLPPRPFKNLSLICV